MESRLERKACDCVYCLLTETHGCGKRTLFVGYITFLLTILEGLYLRNCAVNFVEACTVWPHDKVIRSTFYLW